MFDNLSNRLDGIVKRLRGKGRLTEADVDEVMKEIRSALLEADVNVTVVRSVCNRIREHAIGATRSQALDPGQQVIKAVRDELVRILGGETLKIKYASKPPTVDPDGRSAGLGQDHRVGQVGAVVQVAGPQPAVGRSRPAASRRRRAAAHARPPGRRAGLLRPGRSGAHRVPGRRGGQAARTRRRDRRHRRPALDRQGDDGAGAPHLGCRSRRRTRSS